MMNEFYLCYFAKTKENQGIRVIGRKEDLKLLLTVNSENFDFNLSKINKNLIASIENDSTFSLWDLSNKGYFSFLLIKKISFLQ